MNIRGNALIELDPLIRADADIHNDLLHGRSVRQFKQQAVQTGDTERGIILCGSGVGACIAANKFPGVRAGLCHDTYSAAQGVRHDDMNVLCLGARVVGVALAEDLVTSFMGASLESEPRFQRRLDKVAAIENEQMSHGGHN